MSLINDALRRAKQARQDAAAPAPPAPHLQPAEPAAKPARHGLGILMPISLGVVALLTLLFLWELSKHEGPFNPSRSNAPLAAAARTLPPATVVPAAHETTASVPVPGQSVAPKAVAGPASDSSNVQTGALASSAAPPPAGVPATATVPPGPDVADTNRSAPIEPLAPPPAPLKLQSIVFNPKRPSALISGHVVFVGDRIRDLHVLAIHQDDVVLTGAGRTNLLSLEP